MARRSHLCGAASVITVGLLIATPAAAHGVDIEVDTTSSDFDVVELELTDETGEVCVVVEPAIDAAASVAITDVDGTVVVDIGGGLGPDQACRFLDVDAVNAVLADVDGHRLRIDGELALDSALSKPVAPISDSATGDSATAQLAEDDEDSGPSLPVVFGVGAAVGIGIAVLRSRRRRAQQTGRSSSKRR